MHFLIPYKVNMCKSFLPFCLSFGILRHDISITFYWDKEFLLVFNFFNKKKQLLVNETVWKWFIFISRLSLSFLFFLTSFLWLHSQSGYCWSNLFPTFCFLFFSLMITFGCNIIAGWLTLLCEWMHWHVMLSAGGDKECMSGVHKLHNSHQTRKPGSSLSG